jgi:hypothetical protein
MSEHNILNLLEKRYFNGFMIGRENKELSERVYNQFEIVAITIGRDDALIGKIKESKEKIGLEVLRKIKTMPHVWSTLKKEVLQEHLDQLGIPSVARWIYKKSEFQELWYLSYLLNKDYELVQVFKKIGKVHVFNNQYVNLDRLAYRGAYLRFLKKYNLKRPLSVT